MLIRDSLGTSLYGRFKRPVLIYFSQDQTIITREVMTVVRKKVQRISIDTGDFCSEFPNPNQPVVTMQYSNNKQNGASGVPSMFASSISHKNGDNRYRRTKSPGKSKSMDTSYLYNKSPGRNKSMDRQKVNILALVDGAIEDGATDQAKKKASAERAASNAPIPAWRKAKEPQAKLQSPTPSPSTRRRSKSSDRQMQRFQRAKDASLEAQKDDSSVRSIRSIVKNSPKKSQSLGASPHTPAWKARLSKQGKNVSSPGPMRSKSPGALEKTPRSKGKSPKRATRRKSVGTLPSAPPLSRGEQPTSAPITLKDAEKKSKKEKKEKKEKKKKKKKEKEKENAKKNGGYGAVDNEIDMSFKHDVIINDHKKNEREMKKVVEPPVDTALVQLRKKVAETRKQLENFDRDKKQELSDMEKEFISTKDALRFQFMKDISVQGKKNDEKFQAYKKVVDGKQKEIDDLKASNQRLRATLQKLPKQMSEVIFANHSLEEANKEVARHIEGLGKFDKKLQADQDKLRASNEKCKEQYLPRYRQQLWHSRQHVDAETKIKNLYRDVIIKIAKEVDKSKQALLIEEISSMVLDVEGEVNPKFDPDILSTGKVDSDNSSSSESDDSYSSSSSSSSDNDYG